jgi:uncharacterized protein
MTIPRVLFAAAVGALLWCSAAGLYAQDGPPDGQKRAEEDYSPFPQPDSGYVTDVAQLLTDKEEERIERWLWQVESKTKVEILVVMIDSISDYPATPNQSIEAFTTALFNRRRYGIGNLSKNDGVLFLVSRKDRKARIELGAHYGRSRDSDAERIMQKTIVPQFKKGDFAAGITEGVKDIMLEFARVRVERNWPLIIVLVAIPVVGFIAFSLFRSGKRGWGWACVGLLVALVMALLWIIVNALKHLPKGASSSWGSGGLGGFGGGSSGGGGATGSWSILFGTLLAG